MYFLCVRGVILLLLLCCCCVFFFSDGFYFTFAAVFFPLDFPLSTLLLLLFYCFAVLLLLFCFLLSTSLLHCIGFFSSNFARCPCVWLKKVAAGV